MVDILQDLAPPELEQIGARAPMQSVAAGAVFFSPGPHVPALARRKGFTTAILAKSTLLGKIATLCQQIRDQRAEAPDESVICPLSKADRQALLLSHPRIAETLGQRLLEMVRRLSGTVLSPQSRGRRGRSTSSTTRFA